MTSDRWRRIEDLYHEMLARPVHERAAALHSECAGDPALEAEVQSLLDQPTAAGRLLATPALEVVARLAAPASARLTGRRLGVFEVHELLGVGGMGEVYRARDTRLERDVALKILPRVFQDDPSRLARFEREARVLASLNHPHIGAIHGLEEGDGIKALVMELVDGDDLSQRLARGRIPVIEALTIARQIAEGVEAAHEKGVIHRDLKPANIKVRRDGTVKVLDFGLAKALSPAVSAGDLPTTMATEAGLVIGTPAYMSPEHARGETAGPQVDIWAFGVILYELLTGISPFARPTTADTLASVLGAPPDYALLPPTTPIPARHLIRRCLEKDPKRRWQHMGDVRIELEEALSHSDSVADTVMGGRARPRLLLIVASAFVVVATIVGALVAWTTRHPEALEAHVDITTPPTTRPESFALSPDGRTLAFVASSEGESRLWLRQLDNPVLQVLPGTENAAFPFWSPNSREIAFSVESELKRINLDTGVAQTVAPYISGGSGAWTENDTLLVTPNPASPLLQIPSIGGQVTPVTKTDSRDFYGHRSPQLLPDGRHFMFFAGGERGGIHVGSLTETKTKKILDASAAAYAPTGHLLFVRQRMLYSQPFDTGRLMVSGSPTLVAQDIVTATLQGASALSVSAAGPIAYRTGSSVELRQLVWVDRTGKELEVLKIDHLEGQGVSLSPDDRWVAWTRGAKKELWLFDIGRRVPEAFTIEPKGIDMHPLWSPDSRRLVYSANTDGDFDLFMKSRVGSDDSRRLWRKPVWFEGADDWSEDGTLLYTSVRNPAENLSPTEIWALPIDGAREPFQVVRTAASQPCQSGRRCVAAGGQLSPRGGKWIAFQSNESDRFEIYIQRFPKGEKVQISTGGGVQARWGRDGRELFYLGSDNRLMKVSVDLEAGDAPTVGVPEPLFTAHWSMNPRHPQIRNYAVSKDSSRFLIDVLRETVSPVKVILNWKPKS